MPSTDRPDVKNTTETGKNYNWRETGKDDFQDTGRNYNYQGTENKYNYQDTGMGTKLPNTERNVQGSENYNYRDTGMNTSQGTGMNTYQGADTNYNYQGTGTGTGTTYRDTGRDTSQGTGTNIYQGRENNYQDTGTSNLQDTNQIKQDRLQERDAKETDNLQGGQYREDTTTSNVERKANQRLKMDGLLSQAHESLKGFLNPDLEVEKQIPVKILRGAKGIIFLSVIKGGLIVGGAVGTGVMMTRLDQVGKWSGPCAMGMAGVQFGLNIGAQKADNIIVLRDNSAIEVFSRSGHFKFGADGSIAAGPKGRDASAAMSMSDKGYTSSVCYSMAKGLYIGISLEGQVISIRNDCNEEFYGGKIEPNKIFDGSVNVPGNSDYDSICKLLDDYAQIPQNNLQGNETQQSNLQQNQNPQYNQQSEIPQYNQQSQIPQYNQQSDLPQYNQQGEMPQSQMPQYTQQSQIPQYNQQNQMSQNNQRNQTAQNDLGNYQQPRKY